MSADSLNLAASDFNAAFWLALAGILGGMVATAVANIFTFRTNIDVARTNAASQLAVKQEEEAAKSRENRWKDKAEAVREFVAACDAYWHMTNDLWDRIKRSESVKSYREETGKAMERLTKAKAAMDLVAEQNLRMAAAAYRDELVELSKYVHQKRDWREINNDLYKAMIARAREEIL